MSFHLTADQMAALFGPNWQTLTRGAITDADPESIVGKAIAAQGAIGAWRTAYLTLFQYASDTATDMSTGATRTVREAARQTVVERYDLRRVCLPAWLRLLGDVVGRQAVPSAAPDVAPAPRPSTARHLADASVPASARPSLVLGAASA